MECQTTDDDIIVYFLTYSLVPMGCNPLQVHFGSGTITGTQHYGL